MRDVPNCSPKCSLVTSLQLPYCFPDASRGTWHFPSLIGVGKAELGTQAGIARRGFAVFTLPPQSLPGSSLHSRGLKADSYTAGLRLAHGGPQQRSTHVHDVLSVPGI